MFAKSIFASAAVVALALSGVVAKHHGQARRGETASVEEVESTEDIAKVTETESEEIAAATESEDIASLTLSEEIPSVTAEIPSFNNYLGLAQLSNFDDFFGRDNFAASLNVQTIIAQQQQLVCQSLDIVVVQQKLAILTEVFKRVLLEQVCQVEVQTVIIQQFSSVFSSFGSEIAHLSGRSAAFDSNIASLLGQVVLQDGSLNTNNLGFSGLDIGKNSILVDGNNWDDATSPASVQRAKELARLASNSIRTFFYTAFLGSDFLELRLFACIATAVS